MRVLNEGLGCESNQIVTLQSVATFYVTNGKVVFPWLLHQTPFLTIYFSVSFQPQHYQIKTDEARKINQNFALELTICNTDRQVLTSSTKSKVFLCVIYCCMYFKRHLWYRVSVRDGDCDKIICILPGNDGWYCCLNKLKPV